MSEAPKNQAPEPPKRRFTVTITVDADDTNAVANLLPTIQYELWAQPDQARQLLSGGGYSLTVVENPDGLIGDVYRDALVAWAASRREFRS